MESDDHRIRHIMAATPILDERRGVCATCGEQFFVSYRRGSARVESRTCPLCEIRHAGEEDERP